MKHMFLALLFPLAMGLTLVSCNQDSTTESNTAECCPQVVVYCCPATAPAEVEEAKPQPKPAACDCKSVETKFADIKANRDTAYATATAQLAATLTSKPSCLKFNGTTSWTCGTFSGRDAGNDKSQLVLGGFGTLPTYW